MSTPLLSQNSNPNPFRYFIPSNADIIWSGLYFICPQAIGGNESNRCENTYLFGRLINIIILYT